MLRLDLLRDMVRRVTVSGEFHGLVNGCSVPVCPIFNFSFNSSSSAAMVLF